MVKGQRPLLREGGCEHAPAYPQYWDADDKELVALQPLIDGGLVEVLKSAKPEPKPNPEQKPKKQKKES